jgi:hypothetical protein
MSLRLSFALIAGASLLAWSACAPNRGYSTSFGQEPGRPTASSALPGARPLPDPSTSTTSSDAGPQPEVPSRPEWLAIAHSRKGELTLRCENTPQHPLKSSAGCECGKLVLNPCDKLVASGTDRRQCFFTCAPDPTDTFLVRCPDGEKAASTPGGCACGADEKKLLNPCVGAPKSVELRGDGCSVRCGDK